MDDSRHEPETNPDQRFTSCTRQQERCQVVGECCQENVCKRMSAATLLRRHSQRGGSGHNGRANVCPPSQSAVGSGMPAGFGGSDRVHRAPRRCRGPIRSSPDPQLKRSASFATFANLTLANARRRFGKASAERQAVADARSKVGADNLSIRTLERQPDKLLAPALCEEPVRKAWLGKHILPIDVVMRSPD